MTDHYRRQYANLPDDEFLSPRLVELAAEAESVVARCTDALAEFDRLSSEAAEEAAAAADRQAAADAIRAGKPIPAGNPARDELIQTRQQLGQQLDASHTALADIENDMTVELEKMQTDEKLSGRTALKTTGTRYRKALAALVPARTDYMQAKAVHDFLASAAGVAGISTTWPPASTDVAINTLSTAGEKDYNLRPIPADVLIERTFARDLERTDQ